jgi:hypothetical protein
MTQLGRRHRRARRPLSASRARIFEKLHLHFNHIGVSISIPFSTLDTIRCAPRKPEGRAAGLGAARGPSAGSMVNQI